VKAAGATAPQGAGYSQTQLGLWSFEELIQ